MPLIQALWRQRKAELCEHEIDLVYSSARSARAREALSQQTQKKSFLVQSVIFTISFVYLFTYFCECGYKGVAHISRDTTTQLLLQGPGAHFWHFPLTVMYLVTFWPQRQKLHSGHQQEGKNDERLALFLLGWKASPHSRFSSLKK